MSFDWKEYLKLAEELAKGSKESYLRSSISRAYYSVFCISRNKTIGKDYKRSDVHNKVIEILKNKEDKSLRKAGLNLDELRRIRNKADYDEDEEINYSLVSRMILLAKDILRILGDDR